MDLANDPLVLKRTGVLGSEEFLARLQREDELLRARLGNRPALEEIIHRAASAWALAPADLIGGPTWTMKVVQARREFVLEAVTRWGHSPAETARALGLDKATISRYLKRKVPAP